MKKRITLSIDEDVYEQLQEVPKRVSISEVANFLFKTFIEEIKRGHAMDEKEMKEWIEGTQEGRDFRIKFIEQYGPFIQRLSDKVEEIKAIVGIKSKLDEKNNQ
ncbi:MAG: hypothetical protein HQK96_07525 [Nitrospirae bacterium]|nr:hypothetical protein [Nitrospirota bacterium]